MINDKLLNKSRVRIAPSPTGFLHIGLARTALFNYLFAKKQEGSFVLRIEDTDLERSKPEYEKDILDNLKWLGLDWQEFYRQSDRSDIYEKYIKKLLDEDKAYYCFCSEEELEAKRQDCLSRGEAPIYDGKCRNLDTKIIKKYLDEGRHSIIRFKTPKKKVAFNDFIRGKIEFDSSLIGDFSIAKTVKVPLYNFAVVIDDFEMEINYVIRGEDHISNTPKQILLQEALGFSQPKYAHLPLILGPDRTKLSKRHGAAAISEYRKIGYLPEALVNFMAFLGWNPGTEREIYSMNSLIKEFSLERVQKGGAVFNIKRLDYLNGFYIRQKSLDKLTELCVPYLIEADFIEPVGVDCPDGHNCPETLEMFEEKKTEFKIKETGEVIDFDFLKKIVKIHQERLKTLSEISGLTDFFFKDKLEYDRGLLKWKNMSEEEVIDTLDKLEEMLSKIETENFNKENLEKILISEAESRGDRGKFLWPLRVALTGKKASAGPFEILEILGKEKVLERIREARELFSSGEQFSKH